MVGVGREAHCEVSRPVAVLSGIITFALLTRFGPSNFVANWSTPQLLIHGSKDYRLPETEGLAAFNVLQQ